MYDPSNVNCVIKCIISVRTDRLQEVRDDPVVRVKLNSERLLWEELSPVEVDTHKLEHLFESRAKDFITKVILCNYFNSHRNMIVYM